MAVEQLTYPPLIIPKIRYLESTMSEPKDVMFRGTNAHQSYANVVEADGYEVTPITPSPFYQQLLEEGERAEQYAGYPDGTAHINSPIPEEFSSAASLIDQVAGASPPQTERQITLKSLAASFHESILDGSGKGFFSRVVSKFFPSKAESLQQINTVQKFVGPRPVVLLPSKGTTYEPDTVPYPVRTVQITPGLFKEWGLDEDSDVAKIRGALAAHGLDGEDDGFTIDTFHIIRQEKEDGTRFNDPLRLTKKLAVAGLAKAVHLSVNRTDMVGLFTLAGKATRGAKKAFMESAEAAGQTIEGQILKAVVREWFKNPVYAKGERFIVLEDGPLRIGGFGRIRRAHKAIFRTIKDMVLMVESELKYLKTP